MAGKNSSPDLRLVPSDEQYTELLNQLWAVNADISNIADVIRQNQQELEAKKGDRQAIIDKMEPYAAPRHSLARGRRLAAFMMNQKQTDKRALRLASIDGEEIPRFMAIIDQAGL